MQKPNSENPDHYCLMSDTSDQEHQTGGASQSPARSYECIFCRRGFSNAQALGGHMNIHRKDKANLKQTVSNHEIKQQQQQQEQQQYSSEISKIPIPSYSSPDPPLMNPNWFCDEEGDHQVIQGESRKGLTSSAGRGSSESETLDLELRLGPEPPPHHNHQDSSSGATPTRKFF